MADRSGRVLKLVASAGARHNLRVDHHAPACKIRGARPSWPTWRFAAGIAFFHDGPRSVGVVRLMALLPGERLPLPTSRHASRESVARMSRISCLAGVDAQQAAKFTIVLEKAAVPAPAIAARLDVAELGALKPDLLVCDIDNLEVDPLELVRQLRFVLPGCIIMIYTAVTKRAWSVQCHLAGANGILSKDSTNAQLALGIRGAVRNGCFTDPRFVAA